MLHHHAQSSAARREALLLLLLAILFAASPAAAEPTSAKEHFDRALVQVDQGEIRQAIAEFWRAHQLKPHHSVLFNIAQAHVLLGDPVEAAKIFGRYLTEGGEELSEEQRREALQGLTQQREHLGEVQIEVSDSGATVWVDGLMVGKAPLAAPVRLRVGRHAIAATLEGHRQSEQWVVIAKRERSSVQLTLEPTRVAPTIGTPSGQLQIDCSLPGVELHVENRNVGTTPFSVALLAAPGERLVTFRRSGYKFGSRLVQVLLGKAVKVRCQPELIQPVVDAAEVVIVTDPSSGATILIDEVVRDGRLKLPGGQHRIQVRRAGYEPWSQDINLEPNERRTLDVVLTPTPGFRQDVHERATTQRIWAYGLGGAGLALTIATVAHFLWNNDRHDQWSGEDQALSPQWSGEVPASPDLGSRQQANDQLLLSVLRADQLTVGLGVAAGGLLTAGVVLFFTGDDPGDSAVAVVPRRTGGALSWRSRW